MKLKVHIDEVHIANDKHPGAIRIGFEQYIGQGAQRSLDALAAANKDVDSALLLPQQQQIIIIMARPQGFEDSIKRAANGFILAVQEWYEQLNEVDRNLYGPRPDHVRIAQASNSSAGFYDADED